jgi:Tfp pilus tip-associated adhesin PilY1
MLSTCTGSDVDAAGSCKWNENTPDASFTDSASNWDFFTFRRKDNDIKKGPILYLSGDDYSNPQAPGGERLVLNSLMNLESLITPPLTVAFNVFSTGPIARSGVIYAAKPGDPGTFLAIDDQSGATMWDAGVKLETLADGQRTIYTVDSCGTSCGLTNRLAFSTANAGNAALQAALQVNGSAQAQATITWMRSRRFGTTATGARRLGPIENSTAALITAPRPPYWYDFSTTQGSERALIDTYVNANATRAQRILLGSRDGAVHAFDGDGVETWAFIPNDVAGRMDSDRLAGTATAYPDAPPVLSNAKIGGAWRTVMVMGEGNGGKSVFALDVTEIDNPVPLWTFTDGNMGRTYSKPTVIRVKDNGVERWLAVFASGPGNSSDQGDSVYAVDLTTGVLVWRFDLGDVNAYISTDITATETKDPGEAGGPVVDGYIDRIFFADNKGRVWKLDPGLHTGTTIVPVSSSVTTGLAYPALFSTASTSGALGVARPIAGGIAATIDTAGKLVIFFGTGGSPDSPAGVVNEFYAVYAETGQIKAKTTGAVGEVFGGAAVSDGSQLVIISRFPSDLTNLCGSQQSRVTTTNGEGQNGLLVSTGSLVIDGQLTGTPFIDNGELYALSSDGTIRASDFRGAAGVGTNAGYSSGSGSSQPILIQSWQQY